MHFTRLAQAGRRDTVLVVVVAPPSGRLLHRGHDAGRPGATVLTLDGVTPSADGVANAPDAVPTPGGSRVAALRAPAHDALTTRGCGPACDAAQHLVQHLVGAAAGEERLPAPRGRRRLRGRLDRLVERFTTWPPARW